MSGLWILLVVLVWAGITRILWKVCSRLLDFDSIAWAARVGMVAIASASWLGASFWYGGGRVFYYDAVVEKMCREDGGIRVYREVNLPPDRFNEWGQPNFYKPSKKELSLGEEYILRRSKKYYRKSNPQVTQTHLQAFRRDDNLLLGESIFYGRGGGGFSGPWYESSYKCPDDYGDIPFLEKIFILEKREEK